MRLIEDDKALWGQGKRKMNLSHWNIVETEESSEDWITEDEQESDVIQDDDEEKEDMVSNLEINASLFVILDFSYYIFLLLVSWKDNQKITFRIFYKPTKR